MPLRNRVSLQENRRFIAGLNEGILLTNDPDHRVSCEGTVFP